MKIVGPILDALHRVATRKNIVVIATVGAPKEKTIDGKATARYYGRDALFGSAALARKADTVVLISKTDEDDENAPRQYAIRKRNGGQERFWMAFENGKLCQVERPTSEVRLHKGAPSKADVLKSAPLPKRTVQEVRIPNKNRRDSTYRPSRKRLGYEAVRH